MNGIFAALLEMFAAAVILIPVYGVLNEILFCDIRKSAACFIFSCYLAAVYALVGLPNITYIRLDLNLNFIPVLGMIDDLKNSILNVLLFVPLGIMLPLVWERYRVRKNTVLFGFCMSLTIELLQIFTFRATDINDLITNTFGAFLGFCCAKVLLKRLPADICAEKKGKSGELYIVSVVLFGVMFFVQPFLSAAIWEFIL